MVRNKERKTYRNNGRQTESNKRQTNKTNKQTKKEHKNDIAKSKKK